jgi:membrane protein YqaA with SNARE-associated domain
LRAFINWLNAVALVLGGPGLFAVAFLDSSFISLPQINDVLVVLMVTEHKSRMPYYALMATLGSVAGCYVIYYLAEKGGETFLRKRLSSGRIDRALNLYKRHGLLALMVPALLPPPAPFKLFVLAAGLAEVRPLAFVSAIAVARGIRYLALGVLAIYYGDAALELMRTKGAVVASGLAGRTRRMTAAPELSIVVPLYNEEPNLLPLVAEITNALRPTAIQYELILVDDGSRDRTFEILTQIQHSDARVRVIRFTRNFGQTAGFAAGFAHARGRFIVTLDGDLQNDPADIPRLLEIARDFDIVCGWRQERKDDFLTRHVPSVAANWLLGLVSGVRIHDNGCSLKVFRAEVVKPLKLRPGSHRYLPALASQLGGRVTEVVVNHRPRQFGESKYGLSRTFKVASDLMRLRGLMREAIDPAADVPTLYEIATVLEAK